MKMFLIHLLSAALVFAPNVALSATYIKGGALVEDITSTATAGGTTTLTKASNPIQRFTGSLTQTVVMPDATTLMVGRPFEIRNVSSNIVTVNANGGGLLKVLSPGERSRIRVTSIGSAAGVWDVDSESSALPPTYTRITATGSGTYFRPANVTRLEIKMVGGGGGGGGGGSGGGTGGNGGVTTFGTSLLTANGGGGGGGSGSGGTGGTATIGTGATGNTITGASGSAGGVTLSTAVVTIAGQAGGASPFGGAGGGSADTAIGGAAVANTGSGGGAGGTQSSSATNNRPGGSGAAGGYIEAVINNPSASYSYVVGIGGTAGSAGANGYAAGTGGSGYIEIKEIYGSQPNTITTVPAPNTIKLTTGTAQTYTPPANISYIVVKMVGGGGGGSGSSTQSGTTAGNGGNGGTTSLGVLSAGGGNGGAANNTQTSGGTASCGAIVSCRSTQGASSSPYGYVVTTASTTYAPGGDGATTPFGGAGRGGGAGTAGLPAISNTGSGGGGASSPATQTAGGIPGQGGAAGGYLEAVIQNPTAMTYSIGAGGTAGAIGTSGFLGGAGGSGYIEITEFYTPVIAVRLDNADTDWTAFVPTLGGMTLSTSNLKWRRQGDSLQIQGTFTLSGVTAATQGRLFLPGSLVTDSGLASNQIIGTASRSNSSTTVNVFTVLAGPSLSYIGFGLQGVTGNNPLAFQNADNIFFTDTVSLNATVKIQGWTKNQGASQQIGGVTSSDALNNNRLEIINTVVSKSADYNATAAEETIRMDSSLGVRTLGLPAAAAAKGKRFLIQNVSGSNRTIIDPNGSETICGQTTVSLVGAEDAMEIYSDGTNWKSIRDCERRERIKVATCTTGTCTIASQSGLWVSSVTRSSAGAYSFNIATGVFSVAPTCTCSADSGSSYLFCDSQPGSTTTSLVGLRTATGGASGGTLTDANMDMTCQGPR